MYLKYNQYQIKGCFFLINDVPYVVSKHIGIAVVVFTEDAEVIVWIEGVVSVDSGTAWDDIVAGNKKED